MKALHIKNKSYFSTTMAIVTILFLSNCSTIDSIEADSFSVFNSDSKNNLDEFRRYSENIQPPLIEFILDNTDIESLKFNDNIKKVCDYTKLPFRTTDIKKMGLQPCFFTYHASDLYS